MVTNNGSIRIGRLILWPALITLAITILRLIGELQHWPSPWFKTEAGGGGAIIGITWLPIIFGLYFASKLSTAGEGPASPGKAVGFAVLGLVIAFLGAWLAFAPKPVFPGKLLIGLVLIAVAALIQLIPWRALAKTLIAYGYAARIPVAIVMYFAMRGNWGTHYDAVGPELAGVSSFWLKYLYGALIPQLIFWIAYTVLVGALLGSILAAVARRRRHEPQLA